MFGGATSFDQRLDAWDVTHATDMRNMFDGAPISNCFKAEIHLSFSAQTSSWLYDWSSFARCPSPPPQPPQMPRPSAPPAEEDGAIVELTGSAPVIHFGPVLEPVCSLKLDSGARRLTSTCELATPTSGTRRLDDTPTSGVSVSEYEALKAKYESIKAEVADLRRIVHQLIE